jgi:hypothetical protein
MSRAYSQGKRQREDNQARRHEDKARRRAEKREKGPGSVPIVNGTLAMEASPSVEDIMASLQRGAGGERSAPPLPSRLFVGGLSDEVTESDLTGVFGAFGVVADCIVMRDRDSRAPRGFGFVTMADRKDAPRALEALHGSELKGRRLAVNVATDRGR